MSASAFATARSPRSSSIFVPASLQPRAMRAFAAARRARAPGPALPARIFGAIWAPREMPYRTSRCACVVDAQPSLFRNPPMTSVAHHREDVM
jgi:hypothetical protein